MTFEKLDLIEPILNALNNEGYINPTPIQEKSIPIVLRGLDLLACAQTGTGKTAAFAIPILQKLYEQKSENKGPRKIKALIVTPTRELAIQINESFGNYGKGTNLRSAVIFGGVPQNSQVNTIKGGIDILIATPGRLLDLVAQGFVKLNDVGIFVLDEADRMLDMGFVHDVKKIIKVIPTKRQSLFFSATMPESIMVLASSILTDPEKVEVNPISSTAETIQQEIFYVDAVNKKDLLIHLLQDTSIVTALVFTRTKHGADKVVKFLSKVGISAEAIHGNKSQNARQKALKNFKNQTTRVLVATDIAARGIDIDELAFVFNYEIPNIPETYVHRIGRTGRAGTNGKAITFCDIEEREYLRDIEKLIDIQLPVNDSHPFPAQNLIPLGNQKDKQQSKKQHKPQQNVKTKGSKTASENVSKSDRNQKKKWVWQGGK